MASTKPIYINIRFIIVDLSVIIYY